MAKISTKRSGFAVVELLLALVVVLVVVSFGWYIYKHHNKKSALTTIGGTQTSSNKNSTTATTSDPYAHWSSYTLSTEQLHFWYPNTWKVNDQKSFGGDGVQDEYVDLIDGRFEFEVDAGVGGLTTANAQQCVQKADNVTFNGQQAYLDFNGYPNSNGNCTPPSSTIQQVQLSKSSSGTDRSDFFAAKNLSTTPAAVVSVFMNYSYTDGPARSPTDDKTASQIEADPDYKAAKLVIESMKYVQF